MKTGFEVSRTVLCGLLVVLPQMTDGTAAELKILAPRAIWTVLNEIGSQFEATSGYKLNVITDITATFAKRIDDGESFDIFIGPPAQMDRLIENNRIVANTRTAIARSGIDVEVRTGASKPDISSVDAFKRALLNAKSIGYLKEGASGVYLAGLLDRLGIAEAIRSKVMRPETDILSELVANGKIELGMVVITQILTTATVELVGPIRSHGRLQKNFALRVADVRADLAPGTRVEVWFQDEMRVGQKNKLTYRWARKGSRPRAIHDQRTQSTYLFGAVCPEHGTGAALVLPACNTEAMQLHLNEIATKVTPGAHAILILDQAGWHGAKTLKVPSNISLLPLPPRAPGENAVIGAGSVVTRDVPDRTIVAGNPAQFIGSVPADQTI